MEPGLIGCVFVRIMSSIFIKIEARNTAVIDYACSMPCMPSSIRVNRVVPKLLLDRHSWLVIVIRIYSLSVVSDDVCIWKLIQGMVVVAHSIHLIIVVGFFVGSWVLFFSYRF